MLLALGARGGGGSKGNHGKRISVSWVEGERLGRQHEPEIGNSLKVLGTMKVVEPSLLPSPPTSCRGLTRPCFPDETLHSPLEFFPLIFSF